MLQSKYVTICPNCGVECPANQLTNEDVDNMLDDMIKRNVHSMFECGHCHVVSVMDPLKHLKAVVRTKW